MRQRCWKMSVTSSLRVSPRLAAMDGHNGGEEGIDLEDHMSFSDPSTTPSTPLRYVKSFTSLTFLLFGPLPVVIS